MLTKLKKLLRKDEHGTLWFKDAPVFIQFQKDPVSQTWSVSLFCDDGYSFGSGCQYHSTDCINGYETKKECEQALLDNCNQEDGGEVNDVGPCDDDCDHHVEWSEQKEDWVKCKPTLDINGNQLGEMR